MSKSRNRYLQMAVRTALAGGALVAAGATFAQKAPASSGAALEEIVITGSRIAAPNQVSISPVIAISNVEIEQSGATRVEDLLNRLPQVFAAQGSTVSNGADGTAQVNLRGLGAQRTLVLINGRRLGPGDPRTGGASDLNQIPAELIEGIDIMTGGASSVYGADAVAGVVNFRLNNHFEGVRVTADYAFDQHHQDNDGGVGTALQTFNSTYGANFAAAPKNVDTGFTKAMSFMLGMNTADGKGNATVYASYRNVASVLQSQYDFSSCTVASGYLGSSSGKFSCSGSSTSVPGRFRLVDANGKNLSGSKTLGPNGTLIPFSSKYRYNYGPLNYFQRPDERWSAGAFAHYEFNAHADVYTEFQYMNDRSISQIAPSGAFYGNVHKINCANPFLTGPELTSWCAGQTTGDFFLNIGRRNVEGGPRRDDLEHQSLRLLVGSKGKFADGVWDYDAYASYNLVSLSETYINDLSISRIGRALNVVQTANGPVCQSFLDRTDRNCVPWNIFQPGQVTSGATTYISIPLLQRGELNVKAVNASTTGDLGRYGLQLPSAKSGLKVNVGLEWRQTSGSTTPDASYQANDGAGQGAATLPVAGSVTSREFFSEAQLPLIDDKVGAQSLALNTGYRYSDYSLGFKTNTYKFGVEWAPIQDVRLRGSWARAVRAPNISELYSVTTLGLDGTTDPCAGAAPRATAAQCALTGVLPGQYGTIDPNPAGQYNGVQGGNPHLNAETATTKSFGIGFSPSALPDLRVQVDWYDIKIADVVGTVGGNNIVNLCISSSVYCNRIHRDINGSLWASPQGFVDDPLSNTGMLNQKGIDFDASYRFNMNAAGKLHVGFVGTYIINNIVLPIQSNKATEYDCAGLYGPSCYQPTMRWRHTMRLTWETPWRGTDVAIAWRYFGSAKLDLLSSNPNLSADVTMTNAQLISTGVVSNTDARLGSRSYIDLTASARLNDNWSLRLGVNNLLDKSPPIVGTTDLPGGNAGGNGNTFPQVYDALGRYLFAKVTAQF